MDKITIENIIPLKKFILIKPVLRPEETESGFVMPEEGYSPTPVLGEVVSVGEESQFKAGQIVFFRRFAVDELKFNVGGQSQTVSLLSDDEVVAMVKQDA